MLALSLVFDYNGRKYDLLSSSLVLWGEDAWVSACRSFVGCRVGIGF
jgi:hypothetical protein